MVQEAGAEVDRLREEADALRAFIEAKTNAFAGIAQAALEQLEGFDQMSHPPAAIREPEELLSDLERVVAGGEPEPTAAPEPDATASRPPARRPRIPRTSDTEARPRRLA